MVTLLKKYGVNYKNLTIFMPKYNFAQVVIVDGDLIGVIVKVWGASNTGSKKGVHYEVFVRIHNCIIEFMEEDVQPYMYDKIIKI